MIQSLTDTPGTAESADDWLLALCDEPRSGGNEVFMITRLPCALGGRCWVDRAAKIESVLGPKVRGAKAGEIAAAIETS